jgi:hypothetical protein
MKILYFENTRRDKLNNTLHANIYFYILVEITIKVDYMNGVHDSQTTNIKEQRENII